MRWIVCAAALILFLLGFGLGLWTGKKSERAATWAVAASLLALVARHWLTPARELALFPEGTVYLHLRAWWVIPFAMIPLGVGVLRLSTPFARKGIALFAAGLFLAAARPVALTALFDPREVTGQVGPNGVCIQTTDYTCGAAAAAMLLHAHGVEASEAEMATICGTNALTGTDVYSVAIGLRQQLRGSGREVRVVPADWESLLRRREPALATIRYGVLVDHWVMIRETQPAGAVVLDPVGGLRTLSREDLLAIWRGWLVTADLPTPDLPVTTGAPAPAGTASLGSR